MISLPAATSLNIGIALVVVSALAFLVVGLLHDFERWRAARVGSRINDDLGVVVFRGDADAAEAAARLAKHRRSTVLTLVQRLAADLDGDAAVRLRRLVDAAGLDRQIRRRLKSRSWRRRAQGAGLANLLPAHDPLRTSLLDDPHPMVRARTAEALDPIQAGTCAERLVELLDDDVDAVKFAAQGALLQGGARVLDVLQAYLERADGSGVEWALEVAANLPDPRLVPGIRRHLDAPEANRRAIATRALARWMDGTDELSALLADEDAVVRATAAEAVGLIGAQSLAAQVGRLLGDRSWLVRERAGRALASVGPAGVMTLRVHLDDDDPYAADMARQVLDTLDAAHRAGNQRSAGEVAA